MGIDCQSAVEKASKLKVIQKAGNSSGE
jgi:hypothetical protein